MASPASASYRVLIVEDERDVAQMLARHLQGRGVDAEVVFDGESGWQQFLRWPPDAVLVDLLLPKLNGTELIQRIRQHLTCSRVPVVVISGTIKRAQDEQEVAAQVKADLAFRKPFSVAEVLDRLDGLVATYKRRRPAGITARTVSGRMQAVVPPPGKPPTSQ